jgi:CRP/FNR family transcriptional regulator, cyclic AMP receptor protein
MIEIKDIQRIILFRELSQAELHKIQPLFFEKDYHKGMYLFFEGNPGGILYLVKSGGIEIVKKKGNQEIKLTELGPGDFVGEMSLIDDEPRSASAKMTEDSILMVVTKKNFQTMLSTSPEIGVKILLAFLKILSKRLRETNKKILDV